MRKMLSGLLTISLLMSLILIPGSFVLAKDDAKDMSDITIIEVYEPEGSVEPVSVDFIDKKLNKNKKTDDISVQGEIYEEYDHSYYAYNYEDTIAYDVGPQINDTFLISVAKGETLTLDEEKEVSGSISYTTSVSADIKKVISLEWTGEVTGIYTKTWGVTEEYVGPPEDSIYNSRNYYTAIQYDSKNVHVDRYDVYNVYNGGIYTGQTTYYIGTELIESVKKPKAIKYSYDTTY